MDSSRAYWEQRYGYAKEPAPPSDLAQEAYRWLSRRAPAGGGPLRIVDLGAGGSRDAELLAVRLDAVAVAVDFAYNGLQHFSRHVCPVVADLRGPLPFAGETFDVVISHLTANCSFTAGEVERLFEEIHRILVPGGEVWILVRSIEDPIYRQLPQRGPGLYDLAGTGLHLFSRKYLVRCMNAFEIGEIRGVVLQRGGERYNGLVARVRKRVK